MKPFQLSLRWQGLHSHFSPPPPMFGKLLATQDDGGDEVEVCALCFQKQTTTLCGEYDKNCRAQCIDPHNCGDETVYLVQCMSLVLSKCNSQLWSYVVCCVLCQEEFGVDSCLLGGFPKGGKLG